MKRLICLFLTVLCMLPLFTACAQSTTYTVEEMKITLPDGFIEVPTTRRGSSFESEDMGIKVIRESRDVVEGVAGSSDVSLETYADLVLTHNKLDLPLERKGDCLTYSYVALDEEVNLNFTYYVTVHKSRNAYWLVQFIVRESEYESFKDEIETYLDSIEFD